MKNKLTTLMLFVLALIGQFAVAHAGCCGLFSIQYNEPTSSESYISKIEYVEPSLPEFRSYYIVDDYPKYKTYRYEDHKKTYKATHSKYHYNNHIKIDSVTYDNTVDRCDTVAFRVAVKNIGPLDENDMRVSVTVDGDTFTSSEFDVPEDKTRSKTMNVKAPCAAGNYPVVVKAYNDYHTVEYTSWLYVHGKRYVQEQPVIVRRASPAIVETRATQPIVNNYITVVVSGENGEAQADDTTKIVVKDGKVSVENNNVKKKITNTTKQASPSGPSGKVDVSVSAKELDISKSEGNLLKISVTNNGNKDSLFEIKTDFDATQTFLPESEVVQKGETHTFPLYFTPNEKTGRTTGNVFVIQDNAVVKSIPVTVYASPQSTNAQTKVSVTKQIAELNLPMILGALALIAAIIFALYFSTQNKMLKNKMEMFKSPLMPLHQKIREETYRVAPKYYGPDTYNATWDQVIE